MRALRRQSSHAANAAISRRLQRSFRDFVIHSRVNECSSITAISLCLFSSEMLRIVGCDWHAAESSDLLTCTWADGNSSGIGSVPPTVAEIPLFSSRTEVKSGLSHSTSSRANGDYTPKFTAGCGSKLDNPVA